MANLVRASKQLYMRQPDERFKSFEALRNYCSDKKEQSEVKWIPPANVLPVSNSGEIKTKLLGEGIYSMNDWSFSQLCSMADVNKETVNRLSVDTAAQVLYETFPSAGLKPFQLMITSGKLRSIHGVSYTRLFDVDVLDVAMDLALDFSPPPIGMNGATGLYAGEQDMFAFLIDDKSWVEINGENFAPGFFIWNSEVGRRTVGIETFWYQRICANHIVWDARDVATYSRKHTSNVAVAVDEIRSMLRNLIQMRDDRKDAFAKSIRTAMSTKLGDDAEEATKAVSGYGIRMGFVKQAMDVMKAQGEFTVFGAVDALTRMSGTIPNAGERAEQDQRIGRLLSLAC
ncbi:MAG: DUF932 domain-containing protein [Planctomycetes bacterium]|nr:DUF932 domain-containing protein [Planctomycetota bacterium]